MKKSHPFTELSSQKCTRCSRRIKRRIVEQKTKPVKLCYRCYKAEEKKRRNRDSA
jgi:hypothetical protein